MVPFLNRVLHNLYMQHFFFFGTEHMYWAISLNAKYILMACLRNMTTLIFEIVAGHDPGGYEMSSKHSETS